MSGKKLPNIVLIICDTLGAKHMSLYGYHRKTTPHLERMAEEDGYTVYRKCFTPAPWTTPSHVSLLTGLYPHHHGVHGRDFEDFYIKGDYHFLPQVLKDAGYRTIGISSNKLICHNFGFSEGFDTFIELDNPYLIKDELLIPFSVRGLNRIRYIKKELKKKGNLKKVTARYINYLYRKAHAIFFKKFIPFSHYTVKAHKIFCDFVKSQRDSDKPFFMFINLMETHEKYIPPEGFRGRFVRSDKHFVRHQPSSEALYTDRFSSEVIEKLCGLYDEEVLFLDSILGNMHERLKDADLLDDTLFIITSDHGEALGEHNHFGHVFSIYNETLHIPLIIRYPGEYGIKGENTEITELHDIYATVLSVIDSCLPVPYDSVSLLSSSKREHAFSVLIKSSQIGWKLKGTHDYHQLAYIDAHMRKLILRSNGSVEVYDLNKSFYEEHPINDPEVKSEMLSTLLDLELFRELKNEFM